MRGKQIVGAREMCCPVKEENCWAEIRVGKKVEGMKKKSKEY